MSNIFSERKHWWLVLLLVILLVIPTLVPFFRSDFFYTQDHIFIARIHQMSTALADGHFPVRWAPDLRAGEPLFNFYAPLPYYLGGIMVLFGVDFITSAKILFILSSTLSAITMYVLCQQLFNRQAAILAAIFYTYAPYRAVDIYVRGALSEAISFIFFPVIFYFALQVSKKISPGNLCLLALSIAGLFLNHNVMTLIFLPFLLLWFGYLIWQERKGALLFYFLGALFLGIGLSSSFLLPALLERQFIQTAHLTSGYFDFRAHFVAIGQLFSPSWGYGSSVWGLEDGISFQVGLTHWIILFLACWTLFLQRKKLFNSGINFRLPIFLSVGFLIALFATHNKSTFLWEMFDSAAFIQFPWRFLAIAIFFISILSGFVAANLPKRAFIIYLILIFGVILANFWYFKPQGYVGSEFFDKFTEKTSLQKGIDLTKDYLPIWVENEVTEVIPAPYGLNSEIKIRNLKKKTTSLEFEIETLAEIDVVVPVTFFPGWEVYIDGVKQNLSQPTKEGLINFSAILGRHSIEVLFKDTPIRVLGNLLSLLSLAVVIFIWRYKWLPK